MHYLIQSLYQPYGADTTITPILQMMKNWDPEGYVA